ncbi:hypothetical protein PANT111_90183 [Pantoea brenneri]|uniref:Uncharacterized protein n=1 Tax=Pantoea brenneri TaxID=472694 RepID=A0AAX3JDB5_9GAMM|nr:hypothetical protein PANT111_90183 [Pantoea brenneri]
MLPLSGPDCARYPTNASLPVSPLIAAFYRNRYKKISKEC